MSFLKEKLFAMGFMVCAAGFSLGLLMIRYGGLRHRRFEHYPDYVEAQQRAYAVATGLMTWSAVAALLLLVFGLLIAFGIGPNALARWVDGVVVQERLVLYPDGTMFLGAMPAAGEPCRCYLRLRLPNGLVTEVACDAHTYQIARVGMKGRARLLGRRLVDFVVPSDPAE
jgi:hypothetical protein